MSEKDMSTKKYTKAVTFSFDDGVESDRKLIELFNKYNLKCSFNLNSGKMDGSAEGWDYKGFWVKRPVPFDKSIYEGHEICAHGKLHLRPNELNESELCEEFDEDIKALEQLFDTKITGAAYAFGLYSDDVIRHLEKIGIGFARTVKSTHSFDVQDNLLSFHPTCSFSDDEIFNLAERFLTAETDEPQIFYIWGHSYELDGNDLWEHMEKLCQLLSNRSDVLYGTNSEVFKYFNLM